MGRARTPLVADHDRFLDGLEAWVEDDVRIEVDGRAHSGLEAVASAVELRAELVVVDVTLPDISGFELVRTIKRAPAAPMVVLLSFDHSEAAHREALAVGADGFVAKAETVDRLLPLVAELLRRSDARPSKIDPTSAGRPSRSPEAAR